MVDVSIVNTTSPEANWNRQIDRQTDGQTGRQTYVLGGCASKNKGIYFLLTLYITLLSPPKQVARTATCVWKCANILGSHNEDRFLFFAQMATRDIRH